MKSRVMRNLKAAHLTPVQTGYPPLREKRGAPAALDRKLRATADVAGKGYDFDANNIARILVRHYGDEAEAILERSKLLLDEARRAKR